MLLPFIGHYMKFRWLLERVVIHHCSKMIGQWPFLHVAELDISDYMIPTLHQIDVW